MNANPQNRDVSRALRKQEACDRLNRLKRGEYREDDMTMISPSYELNSHR